MREAAHEIGRLDYEIGWLAGADLCDPRRRGDRHHHDGSSPSGAHRQDRARHRSRRFSAKLVAFGSRHDEIFGLATLVADVDSGSARFARFRDVLDLVAEVGERVEAFRAAGWVSHSVLVDHVFCVRDVKEVSLMLGVKRVNRESVHGSMKVVLAPNIGLEEFRSLHTLE